MSNLRNSQLLQQIGRHPLKAALARCFDIAETFQGDIEFLQLDDGLSPKGRQDALQAKLRAAIRDLRDARAPIASKTRTTRCTTIAGSECRAAGEGFASVRRGEVDVASRGQVLRHVGFSGWRSSELDGADR